MTATPNEAQQRAYIVGIAGGSASGKSTLTATLAATLTCGSPPLRVARLLSDHYFRDSDPTAPQVTLPSGERPFDYNRPDSIDHARLAVDLDALTSGSHAPDVVLLEGLLVLHEPSIRQRLDLGVFIELDADVRALRRLVRNLGPSEVVDVVKGQWIADYYNASARVGHARWVEPSRVHADLIVRGDAPSERTAAHLAAVVRDGLARRVACAVVSSGDPADATR